MRNLIKITLLLLALCSTASAQKVYVSTDGDNSDGTTWAKAFTHTDSLNDNMSAGDTALIAPGDYYAAQLVPVAGNSTADPTVYTCSTNTLASAHTATIWSGNVLSDWILHAANIYKTDGTPTLQDAEWSSEKIYTCVVGGDSIYHAATTVGGVDAVGKFFYDTADDVIYVYPYIAGDPDVTGHSIKVSGDNALSFHVSTVSHIKFFGLNFKMGYNGVVWFDNNYDSDSISFTHCNIAHNIARWNNNSCIIGSWKASGWYTGNSFVACTIYSATSSTLAPTGDFAGSGFLLYGMRQWVVDSCYFYQIPGAGVYVKGATSAQYGMRVSNSTFDGTLDMPYGAECFTAPGFQIKCEADRDSAYGNLFINLNSHAIALRPGDCTVKSSHGGHFFANNTFYNCDGFFDGFENGGDPGVISKIKYNVSYQVESGAAHRYLQDSQATYGDVADWVIDSNYWYDPTYAFVYYGSPSSRDWTYFTTTLNYESGGYNSDPGLNDPANGDFSRPGSSQEMDFTYGGSDHTRFGQWQPTAGGGDPAPTKIKGMTP